MFERFVNGELGKDEWTHEAHLIACWVTLQDRTPDEAVAFLRDAITTHNCGIGIANTETSGYHETLTVFYVTAVAELANGSLDDVLTSSLCDRKAPLTYWSKDRLFSVDARMGWLPPDVESLPWEPAFG